MHKKKIVMLSSDDWGWKTSKYQLAVRFSRNNPVLFVSSIGFRSPTASRSDLFRIWGKLKKFLRGPTLVKENIWVLTPVVIPFGSGRIIRMVNRKIFAAQYYFALRWLSFGKPDLFVFSPNWEPYLESLSYENLMYYCVDEHSGFRSVDARKFAAWDERLSQAADHIFCSAKHLFHQKKILNRNTHYMPHGVNWRLFAEGVGASDAPDEEFLAGLAGPVLLFFGHISYDWVDIGLLCHIAHERSGWNIVLVGRHSVGPGEFRGHPNIHLLGEREYEQLPALCRHADIGIIPFVDSELTMACNPLKLYEYLAAGLPVVSTDIPEVRNHADLVLVSSTRHGFLMACEEALKVDRSVFSPKASGFVKQHDWDSRVERIYALITS